MKAVLRNLHIFSRTFLTRRQLRPLCTLPVGFLHSYYSIYCVSGGGCGVENKEATPKGLDATPVAKGTP
jgi:hypothetical protein